MTKRSEHVKKNRLAKTLYVRNIKENTPCYDCGKQYPFYVMQFDHVRGIKSFQLADVTQTNISMKRVNDEMEKCDIVCANCHCERTHKRLTSKS